MWRIWIDTGGTFTDAVAIDPAGRTRRAKVLSSAALRARVVGVDRDALLVEPEVAAIGNALVGMRVALPGAAPGPVVARALADRVLLDAPIGVAPGALVELRAGEEAPILAARVLTSTPVGEALPPMLVRLGTTRGTNALLERKGARVGLFITRGLGDLLDIGTQERPDLFDLHIRKPEPLHHAVVEVPGRIDAAGDVIEPLDEERVRVEAERLVRSGLRVAAVALMHAWRQPEHEHAVARILRAAGFEQVSCSSDMSPTIKILSRAQTAVVNAALSPVIDAYVARVLGAIEPAGGRLWVMTSAGGLADARGFRPKDSLLSGPAGGAVGAARAARRARAPRAFALDMGGTSTDVARVDPLIGPDLVFEHRVGHARIAAPALAIESVAAGGGSICGFDAAGLRVGPESAGAEPGPACYGSGGPLTLTDAALLLGRLDPAGFEIPISPDDARSLADELLAAGRAAGRDDALEPVLDGLIEIACARTAEAIRAISIRRGVDPADHALVVFGGAGPQYACRIARSLDIARVIVPEDAGLLSALGLGHALVERIAQRQVLRPWREAAADAPRIAADLARDASNALRCDEPDADLATRTILGMRLVGQESCLWIDGGEPDPAEAFARAYRGVFGHLPEGPEIELESVRVIASTRRAEEPDAPDPTPSRATPSRQARAWLDGAWSDVPVYRRDDLLPGARLDGPALVIERHSTTVVEPGWVAAVDAHGSLVLDAPGDAAPALSGAAADELAAGRLSAIADEMGEQLRREALSTNVKERRDYSCAILDARGRLIASAPHVPVHLGALGVCVRALIDTIEMAPGDVVVTNHPAAGGSHLPDVSVVTPVFLEGRGEPVAFVASRAHHAEIGGVTPGSLPTQAATLAEEGVVIPPMHLVRGGRARWSEIERLLRDAPFPSRNVAHNLADLRAQVAANHRGVEGLRALAAARGPGAIEAAMRLLDEAASRAARLAVERLEPGTRQVRERLDDGHEIALSIDIRGGRLRIDLTGTSPAHPRNLNATPAIVRSCVLYALRVLVGHAPSLPLAEGLLDSVDLVLPECMLSPRFDADPRRCPAVGGGNVETSQRLADALIRALALAACSQGTMNNVVFGNADFGYYETVCGGAGAGPGFHGAHAVHTNMTNTRTTDPEILEHRYPVRLERFAIRRGSGGAGRWRGGDGAERHIRFLAPVTLTVLGEHRRERPFGMLGGEPGACAAARVHARDGSVHDLGSAGQRDLAPGDLFILETPGGGGWGAPD